MSSNPFYVRPLIYTSVSPSDCLRSNALLTGSCWTEAETLYNSQQCYSNLHLTSIWKMRQYPYFNWRIPGGFQEYILNITVLWAAVFSLRVRVLVMKKYDVLSAGPYTCTIQSDDKWPLQVNHSRGLMFVFNWVSLFIANKIHCQRKTLVWV